MLERSFWGAVDAGYSFEKHFRKWHARPTPTSTEQGEGRRSKKTTPRALKKTFACQLVFGTNENPELSLFCPSPRPPPPFPSLSPAAPTPLSDSTAPRPHSTPFAISSLGTPTPSSVPSGSLLHASLPSTSTRLVLTSLSITPTVLPPITTGVGPSTVSTRAR